MSHRRPWEDPGLDAEHDQAAGEAVVVGGPMPERGTERGTEPDLMREQGAPSKPSKWGVAKVTHNIIPPPLVPEALLRSLGCAPGYRVAKGLIQLYAGHGGTAGRGSVKRMGTGAWGTAQNPVGL
jgi:hypothetical protein